MFEQRHEPKVDTKCEYTPGSSGAYRATCAPQPDNHCVTISAYIRDVLIITHQARNFGIMLN